MQLEDIKDKIPKDLFKVLEKDISELRPCQEKSIKSGLLDYKNLLVCTPTASGKTLVARTPIISPVLNLARAISSGSGILSLAFLETQSSFGHCKPKR